MKFLIGPAFLLAAATFAAALSLQADGGQLTAQEVQPEPVPQAEPPYVWLDEEAARKEGWKLTLKPVKPVFKAGEQVLVVVTLHNNSREPLYRTHINPYSFVQLDVRYENGGAVPPLPPQPDKGSSAPSTEILPGETEEHLLSPSVLYDMSQPGKYLVAADREVGTTRDTVRKRGKVVSNQIVVLVK